MKRMFLLLLILCLCLPLTVSAERRQLADDADLLTDPEETALLEMLETVSDELNAEIAVVTTDTLDGKNIEEYIDDLYDTENYGYGATRSGVLLVVCMSTRQYHILSKGAAGDAIGGYEIDAIGDAFVEDLLASDYAEAFETFVWECQYYISINGGYGYGHGADYAEDGCFDVKTHLIIALVIGAVAGGIVILVLVGQLKSVKMQSGANCYIRSGSLQITQGGDYYLYRNVTRTPKPQSNSHGGGGGGSRHSGGGRF